jgi:hypothetical protein
MTVTEKKTSKTSHRQNLSKAGLAVGIEESLGKQLRHV